MSKKIKYIFLYICISASLMSCGNKDNNNNSSELANVNQGIGFQQLEESSSSRGETNNVIELTAADLEGMTEEIVPLTKDAVIYSNPSLTSSQIGSMSRGTRISVYGQIEGGQWCVVSYNGRVGYIEKSCIASNAGTTVITPSTSTPNNTGGVVWPGVGPGNNNPSNGNTSGGNTNTGGNNGGGSTEPDDDTNTPSDSETPEGGDDTTGGGSTEGGDSSQDGNTGGENNGESGGNAGGESGDNTGGGTGDSTGGDNSGDNTGGGADDSTGGENNGETGGGTTGGGAGGEMPSDPIVPDNPVVPETPIVPDIPVAPENPVIEDALAPTDVPAPTDEVSE